MKKLVIVADDFGTLPSVNEGIVYLFKTGLPLEVSLVTKANHTHEAINLIREFNMPNIGIHLELLGATELGRPVTSEDYLDLYKNSTYKEVERLASEEFVLFESLVGKSPTHITSHKGIHGNFKLLNFVIEYAKDKDIPIRKPITAFNVELSDQNYAAEISIERAGLASPDHLFAHMLGNDAEEIRQAFLNDLSKVREDESAEIAIHPAFFDKELLEYSSLNYHRTRDIVIFSDLGFIEKIKNMDFTICPYNQI